jgi:tetratricopeptide (TPR) repeat protein
MATDRLEILKSMLQARPEDKLARYGLAMEYKNLGLYDAAVEEFRILLSSHPDYAAAYFHGGQTLEKAGRLGEARAMYEQGIEVTTRTGDAHTRSELQAALDII